MYMYIELCYVIGIPMYMYIEVCCMLYVYVIMYTYIKVYVLSSQADLDPLLFIHWTLKCLQIQRLQTVIVADKNHLQISLKI